MINFDKEVYLRAIENLVQNYNFKDFLSNPTPDTYRDWIDKTSDFPVLLFSGETKVVLWETGWPCVIKIPLMHRDFDYCRAEVRNYKKAVEAHLENFFAFCDLLTNFKVDDEHTVPIYIMEYVEVNERKTSSIVKSYLDNSGYTPDSSMWACIDDMDGEEKILAYLYELLGEEAYEVLNDFCRENYINDLHTGNVGFRGEDIVLIDYSGFVYVERARNDPDWWVL